MTHNALQLVEKYIQQADKAAEWLTRSLSKANSIRMGGALSEGDFDVLENLSSRYARLCDILFQKVFRAIDSAELETSGSLIDVLNRAAKRGIISSDKLARELRELRNTIAHEYTEEQLIQLFEQIRALSPELLKLHQKSKEYATRFLQS